FTPPPPPDFYPLSLHDALPISLFTFCPPGPCARIADRTTSPAFTCVLTCVFTCVLTCVFTCVFTGVFNACSFAGRRRHFDCGERDRKSTRLNSSHVAISYAVFC